MNKIIQFLKNLFRAKLQKNCFGTYSLTSVNDVGDIKILIKQLMLVDDYIDSEWLLAELAELFENGSVKEIEAFIDMYQKIDAGKTKYYSGNPERLVEIMKLIYPEVRFEGLKAVGYKNV